MWAHKHHLYRMVTLRLGTLRAQQKADKAICRCLDIQYTLHTLCEQQYLRARTAFIFILTQAILIWGNLQTQKCLRKIETKHASTHLETHTKKLKVVGILAALTSHGQKIMFVVKLWPGQGACVCVSVHDMCKACILLAKGGHLVETKTFHSLLTFNLRML